MPIDHEVGVPDAPAFPWATPPSGKGEDRCEWCGRDIYRPAVPCSVRPVPGLLSLDTRPGLGDRCKWEFRIRATSHATEPF
jgi:hypothetical protein